MGWKTSSDILFFSWITSFQEPPVPLIFSVFSRLRFFFFLLFPLNARHSADHCVQPERRQVRTRPCKRQAQHFFSPSPSLTLQTHTQKMSTLGKAFLPCHPPIAPSTHPSSPLIRPGFQEHGPETDDPVTSSRASPSLAPSHKLMLTLLTYTVKTLNESRHFLLLLLPFLLSFFESCSCAHWETKPRQLWSAWKETVTDFQSFFFFFSLGAKEVAQPKSSGFDSIAIHFLEKTPPLLAFHRPVKTRLPSPTGWRESHRPPL